MVVHRHEIPNGWTGPSGPNSELVQGRRDDVNRRNGMRRRVLDANRATNQAFMARSVWRLHSDSRNRFQTPEGPADSSVYRTPRPDITIPGVPTRASNILHHGDGRSTRKTRSRCSADAAESQGTLQGSVRRL